MYHPSRGGVRGGRDQFNWDDVKSDKHRENYLGHSVKAPVGRWQKGKDLMWYARDSKQTAAEAAASAREEIDRVKQGEEDAMREALGLARRRDNRPRGNRLDKREQEELFKRTKAGEEVEKPYAEGERIQGLGFAPAPKTEVPEKKERLQQEAGLKDEEPIAQSQKLERSREEHITIPSVQKEVLPDESVEHTKKRKRKEDKRATKEKRREEKRAAKQARREKSKRHDSDSSAEGPTKLVKGSPTRGTKDHKARRNDSDSSDDEYGQPLPTKHHSYDEDFRVRPVVSKDLTTVNDQRSKRLYQSYSTDDEDIIPDRNNTSRDHLKKRQVSLSRDASWRKDKGRREVDKSDEGGRLPVAKGERIRTKHGRDSYKGHAGDAELSDEDRRRRPSVSEDRNDVDHHMRRRGYETPRHDEGVKGRRPSPPRDERERRFGGRRERESSPRWRYGSDHVEDNSRNISSRSGDRKERYSGDHKRERTSSKLHHDSESSEDTKRRQEGRNKSSRVQERQDFSAGVGQDSSRGERSNNVVRKRSRSPVQRKEAPTLVSMRRRHDSDSD